MKLEDILVERFQKQQYWLSRFPELPLIKENAKTFKDLTEGLIPQEDFFIEKYEDISERFHAHFMTKQAKKLMAEKKELEKELEELRNRKGVSSGKKVMP